MSKIKLTAGLATLLAVAGATTAVALPDGNAKQKQVEKRQAAQAKALGSRLGVPASKVEGALKDIRADRQAEAKKRRAANVGKALGVSPSVASDALAKGQAARKAAKGTPKEKAQAFRAAVAKATGKSEAQVQSAFRGLRKQQLERKLKRAEANGTISKKRAEKIQKKIDSGKVGKRVAGALR